MSVEQEVGEGRAVVRVKDGFVRRAVLELDIWKYVDYYFRYRVIIM